VKIYTIVGENVLSTTVLPFSFRRRDLGDEVINVSALSPGIYFITITDEAKNVVTKKIVKM
jgi:hypothetical protein